MSDFSKKQLGLIKNIRDLAKKKNAIILAHNYQSPEIFEVADAIGDSFELSKKAMETSADIIIFAGVHFMAESAKLLNPTKKVLIPDIYATCPMASMVEINALRELKKLHKNAAVVCYINTTAETKSECDVCVTSANAVKICEKLPQKEILFLPDQNLAGFVQSKLPNKKIIPFAGYCHVHHFASEKLFQKAIGEHPDAKVLIHPETPKEMRKYADEVCGTGGMIKYVANSNDKIFLIGTEHGMCARLKRDFPDKEFIPLLGMCPNMKKITLEKIYEVLNKESNEIEIGEEIFDKAKKSLEEMIEMSE